MIFRAVFTGLMAVFLIGGFSPPARAADAGGRDDGRQQHHLSEFIENRHVEGHIAFLHAELHITPAQEPLWAPVAAAMREDVQANQAAEKEADDGGAPESAIGYLENRVRFANLRAQGEARFLNAFRPLYDSLSGPQKKMADELLAPQPD